VPVVRLWRRRVQWFIQVIETIELAIRIKASPAEKRAGNQKQLLSSTISVVGCLPSDFKLILLVNRREIRKPCLNPTDCAKPANPCGNS